MMSIRYVFFDAVGTLIFSQPSVTATYRQFAERLGVRMPSAPIGELLRRHLRSTSPKPLGITNDAIERKRWRRIVGDIFGEQPKTEQLFEQLWARFSEPDQWRVFSDVKPCWRALKPMGIEISIASNFDQRLVKVIQGLAPLREAKNVFHSAGLGAAKPALAFFQSITKKLGVDANQCLLVGDSLIHDVQGALDAGWRGVWIDRPTSQQPPAINASNNVSTLQSTPGIDGLRIDSLCKLPKWIRANT